MKEYRRAIADYDEAIRLAPDEAGVYCNRGLSYLRMDDLDRALADFAAAICLNPKFHLTYNNRGYAYLLRGQYEQALADFQRAIELDPKHPNAYKNLAWLMATCPEAKYRDGETAVSTPGRRWTWEVRRTPPGWMCLPLPMRKPDGSRKQSSGRRRPSTARQAPKTRPNTRNA